VKQVSLNELAALQLVLDCISVKDLISSAMNYMAEQKDTKSQDNANVCSEAISAFLR
jgi:hypothetical protein